MKQPRSFAVAFFLSMVLAGGCKRFHASANPDPVATVAKTPDNLARVEMDPLVLSPDAMLRLSSPARPRRVSPFPSPSRVAAEEPALPAPIPPPARRPEIWKDFNGELAFANASKFVAFGQRVSGSQGLEQTREEIASQLTGTGWQVSPEAFTDQGPDGRPVDFRSLYAHFPMPAPKEKRLLLATHFDTERSDVIHFPGAADGAAGP
ncbi:MAG: hypothetical protein JO069_18715, partial [Verrucomicrobia bacterium]|nr:hypothetical protein [Verrucomicrobiota bacterium]